MRTTIAVINAFNTPLAGIFLNFQYICVPLLNDIESVILHTRIIAFTG